MLIRIQIDLFVKRAFLRWPFFVYGRRGLLIAASFTQPDQGIGTSFSGIAVTLSWLIG
jgi:hypothetical protein